MNVKRIIPLVIMLVILLLIVFCAVIYAQDHEEQGTLAHKVNTESLSGISLFLAILYNEHRLFYALGTTISMAVFGILIALSVDFILAHFGLTISKMEHRE